MVLRQVLTAEGLENIQNHKYKGGVYTPLDNILNPFWLYLVEWLPRWVAPNLVTIAGFLPALLSYVLAWHYCPDGAVAVPRWLAFLTAFSLFLYQTFDAMDGKQARRIGLSTPIGQLFDHGVDCLACLSHHSLSSIFCLVGSNPWGITGLAAAQLAFFMAQWQERYTGVLRTNFGPVGVTETQYGLITVALSAGLLGPELSGRVARGVVETPWGGPTPVGVLCCQAWCAFVLGMCSISLATTTAAACRGAESQAEAEAEGEDGHVCAASEGPPGGARLLRCLADLLPMACLTVLPLAWRPAFFKMGPRLLIYLNGVLAFHYTAKMILFTMSKQPFPALQWSLIPYAGLVALSCCLPDDALQTFRTVVVVYVAGVTLNVAVWIVSVIVQLKFKLGIYILRVGRFDAKKTG